MDAKLSSIQNSFSSNNLPGDHVYKNPNSKNGVYEFWYLEPKSQTLRAMQTDLRHTFNGKDENISSIECK